MLTASCRNTLTPTFKFLPATVTNNKNDIQTSVGGKFRSFEFITEALGWLQIAASPLLIGIAVGAIIYFSGPNTVRLIIGIIVAFAGLIAGIIFANKQLKGKGTVWLMSRLMATPELEKSRRRRQN